MKDDKQLPQEIKMPKMFDWQMAVINGLDLHWHDCTHVVRSKRQCGKSIMLEIILLKAAIEHRKSKSFILEPTFNQADRIYTELRDLIKNTGLLQKENAVTKQVTLINGSIIRCFSGEQREHLRGFTVTGILALDEAAYLTDDVIDCVLPWVDANKAPIIMCSTPSSMNGYFYQFDMLGTKGSDKVFSYDWNLYDTSLLLTPEKLEFYRQNMAKDRFRTDYLGLYLENESAVFGEFGAVLHKQDVETGPYYMGVDWGTGNGGDYTAVTVFNQEKQMVDLLYFNDKDETQTINTIVNLANKWKPRKITVELNSIGRIFYGLLSKQMKQFMPNIIVTGFNTTNESKDRIISNMQIWIQNKELSLIPDLELVKQFNNYLMTFSSTGKRIYNNKPGAGNHDDIVMSCGICLDSIITGSYNISFV